MTRMRDAWRPNQEPLGLYFLVKQERMSCTRRPIEVIKGSGRVVRVSDPSCG